MINSESGKKKLGDVFCDLGKYMLTVIPFTYFMSEKDGVIGIILILTFLGLLFLLFGIYFVSHATSATVSGNARKKKIRVMRNSVFVVEEEGSV